MMAVLGGGVIAPGKGQQGGLVHRAWLAYPQVQVTPQIQLLFLLGTVTFLATWATCGQQCPSSEGCDQEPS